MLIILLFVKSDINLYSFLFKDIASKASSYRLLAGTNEFAEDLTGQRMALNASQWKSETGVRTVDVSNMYLLPFQFKIKIRNSYKYQDPV